MRWPTLMAGVALAGTFSSAVIAANHDYDLQGLWRNPQDSVHVQIGSCGATLCGVVIWANDKAKADARKGGTDPLVGLDLLREIRVRDSDSWRVRVFLPEHRRSVAGTIVMIDDDRFRARSCVLGVVCRSSIWTRIDPRVQLGD
jgi:uncharacterized protein (DUF2147 family)